MKKIIIRELTAKFAYPWMPCHHILRIIESTLYVYLFKLIKFHEHIYYTRSNQLGKIKFDLLKVRLT